MEQNYLLRNRPYLSAFIALVITVCVVSLPLLYTNDEKGCVTGQPFVAIKKASSFFQEPTARPRLMSAKVILVEILDFVRKKQLSKVSHKTFLRIIISA